MATLTLMFLGGFQVRSETGAAITITAKKAKALLAYLALPPGQWVSRDKLAALLWEDSSDSQARSSLRNTLTSLRKSLPVADFVVVEGDRLAIEPLDLKVDVLEFERLVAEATPASLEQAIGLYQGDFLEGFNPKAPAFEDWLMERRSRLREQALGAITTLLDHYLTVQANENAIQLAIRLVSLDPLRESVHRTLMTLYVRQRQYGAALKQYRTCQAVLRRELGLAPEPETEQLYREILQGRRTSTSATAIPEEETTTPTTVPPRNAHPINRGPELRPLTIVT